MRQITFRGKSKHTGKWLYGDLLRNVNGDFAVVPPFDMYGHNECSIYEVEEDTIGQFTGLADKNGKEIYEGDVLECIGERSDNKDKVYRREVVFYGSAFCMVEELFSWINPLFNHLVNQELLWSICGNIHDNPELLKGCYE